MNTRPMLCPPIFYKNLFVSQPFCQEILEKDTVCPRIDWRHDWALALTWTGCDRHWRHQTGNWHSASVWFRVSASRIALAAISLRVVRSLDKITQTRARQPANSRTHCSSSSTLTARTLGTWTSRRAVTLHLVCEPSLIAPTWVSEQERERRPRMRLVFCSQVCAPLK